MGGGILMKERRRAQRVDANLAIRISGAPGASKGETLNISTNGVYFKSPTYIEPMTKVQLELMIPDPSSTEGEETSITCEGVVVRVEPEREDPSVSVYNAAVFFTFLPEATQKLITKYIKRTLST